jgi:hypothetical protein
MRLTKPVVVVDPGWLFIIAGLMMIAAAMLIPPQMQLHELRQKVGSLHVQEHRSHERLRAYSDFLATLEEEDQVLLKRLVAAQLNLIPQSEVPVLVAASAAEPVTTWIESTVRVPPHVTSEFPHTRLVDLVTGPDRQWVLGGACVCLFMGILVGPAWGNREKRIENDADADAAEEPGSHGIAGVDSQPSL